MRAAYTAVDSVGLVVSITTKSTEGQSDRRQSLRVQFAAGGQMRASTMENEDESVIISNGIRVLQINGPPGSSVPQSYSTSVAAATLPGNLETLCFIDYDQQLNRTIGGNMYPSRLEIMPTRTWSSRTWTVLREIHPPTGGLIEYYIDPKSHFIHRTVTYSLGSGATLGDYRIRELNLNPQFSRNHFSLQNIPSTEKNRLKL
jgi:outer membrane lipoprotein-sorting protein